MSWQTRYWIDDMYMISAIQSQAFGVTNDTKYIERAAFEMAAYLDKIQRPNGLFFHAEEAAHGGSVVGGVVDVGIGMLRPFCHPHRLWLRLGII